MTPKKEPKSIFALIDGDDKFQGWFRDKQEALYQISLGDLNEAKVFEVVAVYEAYVPNDPEYELIPCKLSDAL